MSKNTLEKIGMAYNDPPISRAKNFTKGNYITK